MPHQALGHLVLGLWKARVGWASALWEWWLRWGGAQSPPGLVATWWNIQSGTHTGCVPGDSCRSGVLSSSWSLSQCPDSTPCPTPSGRDVGGVHCVWFALLKGYKWLLWGDWCQVWGAYSKSLGAFTKAWRHHGAEGLGSFWKYLVWERVEVTKWCCCCHRLSETLEELCCRWQLRTSLSVLRSISPCCFAPSCLIYEVGLGWCPPVSPVCCVPTCWAGLAWWEWWFPAMLKYHCTIDRAADGCEHHSCFLFAINAGFVPWTRVVVNAHRPVLSH